MFGRAPSRDLLNLVDRHSSDGEWSTARSSNEGLLALFFLFGNHNAVYAKHNSESDQQEEWVKNLGLLGDHLSYGRWWCITTNHVRHTGHCEVKGQNWENEGSIARQGLEICRVTYTSNLTNCRHHIRIAFMWQGDASRPSALISCQYCPCPGSVRSQTLGAEMADGGAADRLTLERAVAKTRRLEATF